MDKFTIKNLDLFYGDFQALKSIHLALPANEITAFIGPSGCGKEIEGRKTERERRER